MDAAISAAHRRHPWLDRLIADPAGQVRALAEGTAAIQPYGRAEPSDAAATVLFGLGPDDPAVVAFDRGALEALSQYRTATARAEGAQLDRIALAARDLLAVVQRLAPRDTVIDLHRRFPYWHGWAETLVLDRGLDLRREYLRVLALTQDIAVEARLPPRRLLPFWLDMCGEAGPRGRYDDSYLAVGLVGLRSLPLGEEGANEEAALYGLARWADAQRPAKARFLREWGVLEDAFPRDPTFWTDLVARVLASVEEEIARETKNARTTFPAAAWWREDVEAVPGAQLERRPAALEPPPRDLHEALLADIRAKGPFGTIEPRLRALMQRHEGYATRTGDTFYVVRTACYIGMELLKGGDVPERRAATARELARLALRFEPANVYGWALWRDALAGEGHLQAAELVGWEAVRRFPENPQWRNQLALLLSDKLGRPQESEALLRETMRLFPEDRKNVVVARTQLANVVGRDPARLNEAIAILNEALAIEPKDRITKDMKRRFEQGRTSRLPDVVAPQPAAALAASGAGTPDLPPEIAAAAQMRRALFRVCTAEPEAREVARREVETLLQEDESLAYARYAAAAAGLREPAMEDTVMAAAFLAAARQGSAAALRPFVERAQGIEGVVIVTAAAAMGDEDARMQLDAWMAEPANDLSPRDQGLRDIAARTREPLPADLAADMLAASLGTALAA